MAVDADRQHVLELLLSQVTCARTLLACSMVSTELRQHTRHAVQQNFPAVVSKQQHVDLTDSPNSKAASPLLWLCSFAGSAAVNRHESGCTLLSRVRYTQAELAAELLAKTGLQLTPALLMHTVNLRMDACVLALQMLSKEAAFDMPIAYLQAAALGYHLVHGKVTQLPGDLSADRLVARVTADQLPDILLLLVYQATKDKRAAQAAMALLERDRTSAQLRVLHSAPSTGSSRNSKAAQDQQQRRLTQQQAVELVEELLTLCVTYDMEQLCQRVAALPAAQHVGPAKISQLLYVAFMQLKAKQWYKGPSMLVLTALTGLAGAVSVSAGCALALVRLCMLKKDSSKLDPVLQLPCMQQLSSDQLCALIVEAGHAGMTSLVSRLCRLAHGRTLERDAVLQLLQHCIEHPFPEQHERGISNRRTATLHQLKGLEPGRHITGDDILSLLEQCIKHFDFMETWEALHVIAAWAPARSITDMPRFLSVVETIAKDSSERDLFKAFVDRSPVRQQLQLGHWVHILHAGLSRGRSSHWCVDWVLHRHPGLHGVGADDLSRLLVAAAKQGVRQEVEALTALPAAQQVQPAVLAEALQAAARQDGQAMQPLLALPALQQLTVTELLPVLQELLLRDNSDSSSDSFQAFQSLLTHRAAEVLSVEAVQQLLNTAKDQGVRGKEALACLAQLPQAAGLHCRLSSQRLLQLLQTACSDYHGYRDSAKQQAAVQLMQEPAAQELTAADVAQLLHRATKTMNFSIVAALQGLPGFLQLDAQALLQLIQAAVKEGGLSGWVECLRPYVAHPAAAAIDAEQVRKLFIEGLERVSDATAFQVLLQPPAAQQLDTAAIEGLIRTCIMHGQVGALSVLLQHSAAQAINATVGMRLIKSAITQGRISLSEGWYRAPIMDLTRTLLQGLPVVARFGPEHFEELMWCAIQSKCDGVQELLAQLPATQAAIRCDETVAAMFGAVQDLEGRVYPTPRDL